MIYNNKERIWHLEIPQMSLKWRKFHNSEPTQKQTKPVHLHVARIIIINNYNKIIIIPLQYMCNNSENFREWKTTVGGVDNTKHKYFFMKFCFKDYLVKNSTDNDIRFFVDE